MEQKSSLKLKLKLGNGGSSTPESNSPAPPEKMADEDVDQVMSEEEGEYADEWQDDQGDNNVENCDEGETEAVTQNRTEDGSKERHKKSKKKKKKKEKERHKHKHRDRTDADEDEPSAKRVMTHNQRGSEDVQPQVVSEEEMKKIFKDLLDVLLQRLQKKDPQNIFAHPVTDEIAPGYSTIITNPMNFGKMREKIDENQYSGLAEFSEDLKLICNNCMKYNQNDTVFYKAGQKLLHAGEKILSPDRICQMKADLPGILNLSTELLGFDIKSDVYNDPEDFPFQDNKSSDNENSQDESNKSDSQDDEASAAEILEQAMSAADDAAEKLTLKKPESALGFLRQRKDGTTTLNFLTGCEGGNVDSETKEKPISLGLLTGKLTQGSSTLHNYRDDKRNLAKPVKPLYYGSFSSFCPSYDSTFANLNKEESEMVYATYGNETAVQYAESICDFSKDCDTAMHLVDQLLNLLTHEQHSKTKSMIEERRRLHLEEQKIHSLLFKSNEDGGSIKSSGQDSTPNFASLHSLQDLGIDTSFLSAFENIEKRENAVGTKLNENAALLANLAKEQKVRLSKPLPRDFHNIQAPSQTEINLAEKVTDGLISVAREIPPGALAPLPIVRRALGITMAPMTGSETPNVNLQNTSKDSAQEKVINRNSTSAKKDGSKSSFENSVQDTSLPVANNSIDPATDRKLKEILQSS